MHNSHDDKSANSLSERREPTFGALNEHPNTSGSTGQVSGNGVGHFSAIDDFDPLHPNKPNPAVPPMPRFDASQEPAKPGAAAPAASQPPQTQVPPQPTSQPQASKSEPAPQATELHLRAAAQQSACVVQPNNASAAAQSDATSAPTGAHGSPVGVIFADVNELKRINDTFGHDSGTFLIRMVSDLIKEVLGSLNYQLFRIGGDEFVVILPDCDQNQVWVLEQKLKESLANTTVPHFPKVLAAVGSAWQERVQKLEDVVAQADCKMYEHKRELKATVLQRA